MVSMMVPTPGTPAVPIEAAVAVTTTVISWDIVRSMPKAWAAKTTATPCMIAVPFMLMVAPRGMVNDEILGSTPTRLLSVSMLSGMVALEELVENAKTMTGQNFLRKCSGLRRVNTKRMSMKTTSSIKSKPM